MNDIRAPGAGAGGGLAHRRPHPLPRGSGGHAGRRDPLLRAGRPRSARRALSARALALEGQVALHRGDIRSGLALALEAERLLAGPPTTTTARTEVAALRRARELLHRRLLRGPANAERAIEFADASDDIHLQIFARRAAFIVFGNVSMRELDRATR